MRSPVRWPVLAVCLVSTLPTLTGCGGSVAAPTSFKEYNSPSGRFSCDYPEGWDVTGGGKPDSPTASATFSKGNAKIYVEADLAGSLMGDMAKAGGGIMNDQEPPVARVHPMRERQMKEDYSDYNEREAKPVQAKLGEGRRSTFTAKGTLGGKVYGYRATFLSGDRRITVICTSAATNWQALKPAFEKVIASVRQ